jgi:diacylglycerol kinase family enzyme
MSDQRRANRQARLLACASLAFIVIAAAGCVAAIVSEPVRGVCAVILLFAAVAAAGSSLTLDGKARVGLLAFAVIAAVGAVVLMARAALVVDLIVVVVCLLASAAFARRAFAPTAATSPAPRPTRAVLFWNPRSGGGRAARERLDEHARERGYEVVVLEPGLDLATLVRDWVQRGADALAAAGGDGTQATVAAVAAEHDLPFICIPAGTRNHFALDLGVDREDIIGALDAVSSGQGRTVDLADVNGYTFVNNVSLGIYADAVQRSGYRDAKLRTIARTTAELGQRGDTTLRWPDEQGVEHNGAAVVLVSNNSYRLGRLVGSGTRPRLDSGRLGVAVLDPADHPPRVRTWSTAEFTIGGPPELPIGLDGESLTLKTPLRFTSRPAALRVLLAAAHPGASPASAMPERFRDLVPALVSLATGANGSTRPAGDE